MLKIQLDIERRSQLNGNKKGLSEAKGCIGPVTGFFSSGVSKPTLLLIILAQGCCTLIHLLSGYKNSPPSSWIHFHEFLNDTLLIGLGRRQFNTLKLLLNEIFF